MLILMFRGDAMKTCFKCKQQKELSLFYKHKMMADGYLNKCIDCTKQYEKERRQGENRNYILEYDRKRSKNPERISRNKTYTSYYRLFNEKRYKAHNAVNNAIRDGRLQKLPCFVCGGKSEAHHPDYDRPLDVVWLCSSHHKQTHSIARY